MAKLSRTDVLKLARLARLQLTDKEVDQLSSEISAILGYVDQLQSVDLTDIKPTNQVTGLTNVMRPDILWDYGYDNAHLLKNLPAVHEDKHIKVKRMLN